MVLILTVLRSYFRQDSHFYEVDTFLQNRIIQLLADQGYAKDAIAAVVDVSIDHCGHNAKT